MMMVFVNAINNIFKLLCLYEILISFHLNFFCFVFNLIYFSGVSTAIVVVDNLSILFPIRFKNVYVRKDLKKSDYNQTRSNRSLSSSSSSMIFIRNFFSFELKGFSFSLSSPFYNSK